MTDPKQTVTCKNCGHPLPPDHKGPCPECGKEGKLIKLELHEKLGLSDSVSVKLQRPRAIVFIDGSNLHRGLKECYGIERLNLEPFCKHIVQNRELRGIYYAEANFLVSLGKNNYDRQQRYFSYIRKIKGLRLRMGRYSTWTKPPTEKKSDVYLATDMVDLCHRDEFDIAYLVAGDTDYSPAIDILVEKGKQVINVYFDDPKNPRRNSYSLRRHCNGGFKNITRKLAMQFKW